MKTCLSVILYFHLIFWQNSEKVIACLKSIFYCIVLYVHVSISSPFYIHLCLLFFWLLLVVITIVDYIHFNLNDMKRYICCIFSICFYCLHCCLFSTDVLYMAADRLPLLLSVSVLFSFSLFSVLAWPALMFLFSSRSPPPKWNGEESSWKL